MRAGDALNGGLVMVYGILLCVSLAPGPGYAWAPTDRIALMRETAELAVPEPGQAPSSGGRRNGLPKEEPSEYDEREVTAYYDWRNDLFFREFDLSQRGVADFMTARRTYRTWTDEFGTPVVITMPNPLFYWVDLDADGEFEPQEGEMWSDPEEDGLNGNERPYGMESPGSSPPGAPLAPVRPSWQRYRTPLAWNPATAIRGDRLERPRHA